MIIIAMPIPALATSFSLRSLKKVEITKRANAHSNV